MRIWGRTAFSVSGFGLQQAADNCVFLSGFGLQQAADNCVFLSGFGLQQAAQCRQLFSVSGFGLQTTCFPLVDLGAQKTPVFIWFHSLSENSVNGIGSRQ